MSWRVTDPKDPGLKGPFVRVGFVALAALGAGLSAISAWTRECRVTGCLTFVGLMEPMPRNMGVNVLTGGSWSSPNTALTYSSGGRRSSQVVS